jgi:regulator of sigma E protease
MAKALADYFLLFPITQITPVLTIFSSIMDFVQGLQGFFQAAIVFIPVLGVLVTVHELGHFLAARLVGMRADVFAVGMGNRVMGFNKRTGFTFGSLSEEDEKAASDAGYTDYRLSMLPIGGYVKIAGMIDESMDDSYLTHEPQPWEFRSKNALQKLFVMVAGVVMNILLAIVIFSGIVYLEGRTVIDTTTIGFVEKKSLAENIGLRTGDKILSVNGEKPSSWNEIFSLLLTKHLGENRTIVVERVENGQRTSQPIVIPDKTLTDAMAAGRTMIGDVMPAGAAVLITGVETLKPAGKLGLMANDTLLAINNTRIFSPSQLVESVKGNIGKELTIEWKRGGSTMSGLVVPDKDGRIGVAIGTTFTGGMRRQNYGIFESVAQGTKDMMSAIELQVMGIAQLISGKVSVRQSVGGPIQIAKMSKQSADAGWSSLLRFTALLSVMLAIMNILPFPALDGGHVVFILIESVIRREVPAKVKMAVQQAGVLLLLCFMVFVFYNDLTR